MAVWLCMKCARSHLTAAGSGFLAGGDRRDPYKGGKNAGFIRALEIMEKAPALRRGAASPAPDPHPS